MVIFSIFASTYFLPFDKPEKANITNYILSQQIKVLKFEEKNLMLFFRPSCSVLKSNRGNFSSSRRMEEHEGITMPKSV